MLAPPHIEQPNIAGLSKQLYEEVLQFAAAKAQQDPAFKEAWDPPKRIYRKDPKNPGPPKHRKIQNPKKSGSASVVVMDQQGMILMVIEQRNGQLPFGIPGGSRNPGEHWLYTVAREFQEETRSYVHGKVLDIYFSGNKDMIIFVQVKDWAKDLVPCPLTQHTSATVYMALLSLETMLDATRSGEELYFTLDGKNRLVYRDPKKVQNLEKKRGKPLSIVQNLLYKSCDNLDIIREKGVRIRQAHRNDLNNKKVLEIFQKCLNKTIVSISSQHDLAVSLE